MSGSNGIGHDEINIMGESAYTAYCDKRGWVGFAGSALPLWDNQAPELREAWCVAINAALDKMMELFNDGE